MAEEEERKAKAERQQEDLRKRETARWEGKAGNKMSKNVIKPVYEKDETLNVFREVDAPPEALFVGLGWDEDD